MTEKDRNDRLLGIALGVLGFLLIALWIASSLDLVAGIPGSVVDLFLLVGICLIFLGTSLISLVSK
jgi:hypothetical protein